MPTGSQRKALGERIIPVMRARDDHGRPGRIARYLSDYADDTTRGMIRFSRHPPVPRLVKLAIVHGQLLWPRQYRR